MLFLYSYISPTALVQTEKSNFRYKFYIALLIIYIRYMEKFPIKIAQLKFSKLTPNLHYALYNLEVFVKKFQLCIYLEKKILMRN